jgi:GH24 family phage-related lysozyme (muramidase)
MATAKQIKTLQVRLDATFGKGKVKATEDTWSKNKAALDTMEAAGKVPILDPSGTLRGTDAVSKTAEVYSDVTSEYKDLLAHLSGEEGYNPNFYLDSSGILTTGVGLTAEYVADPSPLRAMTEKTNEAKMRVPKYAKLHPQVQLALVDSAYRGDLTNTDKDTGVVTSQKWVDHVNNGDFRAAAVEHINHAEYNKAKGINGKSRGLIPRFDWRAAALKRSAEPQIIQQMQDRSKSIYDQREDAAMLNGMGSGITPDKVPESNFFGDAFDSVSDFMDNLISTGVFPEQKVPPKTTQDIPVPEQGATVPETENEMATQAQVNSYLKKRNESKTREPVDTVGEYIGPNEVADNPMYREELKQLMQREDVNRMQQGQLYKVPVPTIDNDIPSVANGGVFPFPAVIPQGTVDPGLLAAANQQQMMMNQGRLQQSQLNMMNPQGTVDPGLVTAAAGQQLAMMQQAVKDSEREPAAIAYPSKQSHMDNILQQTQLNLDKKSGENYHFDRNGQLVIDANPHLANPAIPMGTVLSGGQPVRASNGSMVGSPTQNPALKAPAGGKGANATPQSAIAQLTGMKGIGGK